MPPASQNPMLPQPQFPQPPMLPQAQPMMPPVPLVPQPPMLPPPQCLQPPITMLPQPQPNPMPPVPQQPMLLQAGAAPPHACPPTAQHFPAAPPGGAAYGNPMLNQMLVNAMVTPMAAQMAAYAAAAGAPMTPFAPPLLQAPGQQSAFQSVQPPQPLIAGAPSQQPAFPCVQPPQPPQQQIPASYWPNAAFQMLPAGPHVPQQLQPMPMLQPTGGVLAPTLPFPSPWQQ